VTNIFLPAPTFGWNQTEKVGNPTESFLCDTKYCEKSLQKRFRLFQFRSAEFQPKVGAFYQGMIKSTEQSIFKRVDKICNWVFEDDINNEAIFI
jgi:hypothetical protein